MILICAVYFHVFFQGFLNLITYFVLLREKDMKKRIDKMLHGMQYFQDACELNELVLNLSSEGVRAGLSALVNDREQGEWYVITICFRHRCRD